MLRRALNRTRVVSQRLRNTYIPQAENNEARTKVAQVVLYSFFMFIIFCRLKYKHLGMKMKCSETTPIPASSKK
jgi:hypothetical protein